MIPRSRNERRFLIRPGRTHAWWDSFVSNVIAPEEWVENFRMSRDSFLSLCGQLEPHIKCQRTRMREPVEVDRQVALTLYYLSDQGHMRTSNSSSKTRGSAAPCTRITWASLLGSEEPSLKLLRSRKLQSTNSSPISNCWRSKSAILISQYKL